MGDNVGRFYMMGTKLHLCAQCRIAMGRFLMLVGTNYGEEYRFTLFSTFPHIAFHLSKSNKGGSAQPAVFAKKHYMA